jgi:hypothetical protein
VADDRKQRTGDAGAEPTPAERTGTDTADTSASGPAPGDPGRAAELRTDAPLPLPNVVATPQLDTEPAGDGYVSALPILVVGAAGPDVQRLANLLQLAGHENAVAKGERQPILDDALMATVREFQDASDHDPRRAEAGAERAPYRRDHGGVVDARTWERLYGRPVALGVTT